MTRRLLNVLAVALLFASAANAQMLQGIVAGDATGGGGSSFVGTCNAQSGCTLFYGAAAATTAKATAGQALFDYSCTSGSPSTGTVSANTTTGYAPQTIFTSGGACGHAALTSATISGTTVNRPVIPTKIYEQIGSTACGGATCPIDLAITGSFNVIADSGNGNPAFMYGATGGGAGYFDATNTMTLVGQPQGLSAVFRAQVRSGAPFLFTFFGNPELQLDSVGGTKPAIAAGVSLETASTVADDVMYGVNAGASGATSNVSVYNPSTNTTGAGDAGTSTAGTRATIGDIGSTASKVIISEIAFWDSNTAWNNTNFAATDAAVRAQKCTNWMGATC